MTPASPIRVADNEGLRRSSPMDASSPWLLVTALLLTSCGTAGEIRDQVVGQASAYFTSPERVCAPAEVSWSEVSVAGPRRLIQARGCGLEQLYSCYEGSYVERGPDREVRTVDGEGTARTWLVSGDTEQDFVRCSPLAAACTYPRERSENPACAHVGGPDGLDAVVKDWAAIGARCSEVFDIACGTRLLAQVRRFPREVTLSSYNDSRHMPTYPLSGGTVFVVGRRLGDKILDACNDDRYGADEARALDAITDMLTFLGSSAPEYSGINSFHRDLSRLRALAQCRVPSAHQPGVRAFVTALKDIGLVGKAWGNELRCSAVDVAEAFGQTRPQIDHDVCAEERDRRDRSLADTRWFTEDLERGSLLSVASTVAARCRLGLTDKLDARAVDALREQSDDPKQGRYNLESARALEDLTECQPHQDLVGAVRRLVEHAAKQGALGREGFSDRAQALIVPLCRVLQKHSSSGLPAACK